METSTFQIDQPVMCTEAGTCGRNTKAGLGFELNPIGTIGTTDFGDGFGLQPVLNRYPCAAGCTALGQPGEPSSDCPILLFSSQQAPRIKNSQPGEITLDKSVCLRNQASC